MTLWEDAHVGLILADYIGIDPAGKINALGAGIQVLGHDGTATAPHHLVEALRVQQLVTVNRPSIPGVHLPDMVSCQSQMSMALVNGLPLEAGRNYQWRVDIDGNHLKDWVTEFYVPAGPALPVSGGPAGSPTIPGVPEPT